MEDNEIDINPDGDDVNVESVQLNEINTNNLAKHKLVRLPLARVKAIMKKDPNCVLTSQDAVFLVTKSTEMFIEFLAQEVGKQLATNKRKTVMKRDIEGAIENCPQLCFLDGALE